MVRAANASLILGGLLAASLVACGGAPTAVQTSPAAPAAQASPTATSNVSNGTQASCIGAKGCAHYEITGGLTASGDLPLMSANPYKDSSALLDYKGAALFSGVSIVTEIHISIAPPDDQFTLHNDGFATGAGQQQKCSWNIASVTAAAGSGNFHCDTVGVFTGGHQEKVNVKITFDYHS